MVKCQGYGRQNPSSQRSPQRSRTIKVELGYKVDPMAESTDAVSNRSLTCHGSKHKKLLFLKTDLPGGFAILLWAAATSDPHNYQICIFAGGNSTYPNFFSKTSIGLGLEKTP
eukprot:4406614-Amphidinium_carterae.1